MRIYGLIFAWFILSNIYIIWRTYNVLGWFREKKIVKYLRIAFAVLYGIMALSFLVAFFLPEGDQHRLLQKLANYFQGVMLYTLMVFVLLELSRLVIKLVKPWKSILSNKKFIGTVAIISFAIITSVSIYGFIHSRDLHVNSYDVQVDKNGGEVEHLKVVLIADTHIGYSVGSKRIADMVEKINQQDADIVLYAGDVFDNTLEGADDLDAIRASLKSIQSKYGVYVTWGNHDIDERLFSGFTVSAPKEQIRSQGMEDFITDCGFTILEDESVLVADSFYLIGRKDYEKAGDGTSDRASLESLMDQVDLDKPVLLMEHEPRFLQEAADAGVDLMFSGHTHAGQIFPINLLEPLMWQNPVGELQVDGMTSYVTAGVGVYGPDMRVGTDADITVVDITFGK